MSTNRGLGQTIYTPSELEYLCSQWNKVSRKAIAKTLGRTEGAIQSKISHLRQSGIFDLYAQTDIGDLKLKCCIHQNPTEETCRVCGKNDSGFCRAAEKFCVVARNTR